MRILERGVKPEEKIYRHRCTRCRSLFEFARHEADHHAPVDQRDTEHMTINCPVCMMICSVGMNETAEAIPTWGGRD